MFFTVNSLSTFQVSTLVMNSELSGTSSDGWIERLVGTLFSNAAQLWQPHPSYHSYGLPIPPCQTTPGAAATLPCSPDRHHLRQWVMDTSARLDHCRLRGEGRHPAPRRGSTRLSLFLQIAPSGLTQDPLPRQRTVQFCFDHTSSPDQTGNSCTPASHRPTCSFSFTHSSSSSSPNDARPAGSVLPDVLHIRPAPRLSVTSWWERSQAIGLPVCRTDTLSPSCSSQIFSPLSC